MILSMSIAVAFALYVYLAVISVTMLTPRSLSHWLLFAASCSAAWWTFFSFFAYNADTITQLKIWFNISTLGMFIFFPLNLIFTISIIPYIRITRIVSILILLPGLILFILNFLYPISFSNFIKSPRGWIFVPAENHTLNLLWLLYAAGVFLTAILLLLIWLRRTSLNRERRQIRLLVITEIIAEAILFLEYRLNELLTDIRPASVSPIIISIWVIGMVIAVKRYNFLSISPENISDLILNSLYEPVILLAEDQKIRYMNSRAATLLERSLLEVEKTEPLFITGHPGTIIPEALKRGQASDKQLNLDLSFERPSGEPDKIRMKVSRLEDRFGDPLGYLFVGQETSAAGIELSQRELEIAELIKQQYPNSMIAKNLNISKQTVKNHIVSIYRKTGISNRIQLINFLNKK